MKYSVTATTFQPNQSSASTTDSLWRNIICLVSLAIVQLDLEVLIVFYYNFLWHFCHLWKSVIGWWGSPLGDAISHFSSVEMLRNLIRLTEKEYLQTDLVHRFKSVSLSVVAYLHSLVLPVLISSQWTSKLLHISDEWYLNTSSSKYKQFLTVIFIYKS